MRLLIIMILSIPLYSCSTIKPLPINVGTEQQKQFQIKNKRTSITIAFPDAHFQKKYPNRRGKYHRSFTCYIDDIEIAHISRNTFTKLEVAPGRHMVICKERKYNYKYKQYDYLSRYGEEVIIKLKRPRSVLIGLFPTSPVIDVQYTNKTPDYLENSIYIIPNTPSIDKPFLKRKSSLVFDQPGKAPKPKVVKRHQKAAATNKSSGQSKGNTATDCASYIAAKKACNFIPFGASVCINGLFEI